jgi:hypothetical protein
MMEIGKGRSRPAFGIMIDEFQSFTLPALLKPKRRRRKRRLSSLIKAGLKKAVEKPNGEIEYHFSEEAASDESDPWRNLK